MGAGESSPNHPDLADIYALEANPNDRYLYRFDGAWRRLETRESRVVARLWGPIRVTSAAAIAPLRSRTGFPHARGAVRVRYAGQDDL